MICLEYKNMDKTFRFRWIIEILVVLLLAAYGFIFNSFSSRMFSVEAKFESLNPVLLQIQTDLSGIKADLVWLKQSQLKDLK